VDYARTVSGTDALSGVQRIEYSLDGGATQTTPNVTITGEGSHTLATRVVDVAGNVSDWRTDTIGIDRTVPSLTVDCGTTGWRNTQATCSVAATGGLSGLAAVTANGAAVVDGSYAVPSQGVSTIRFRALDGAGNETTAAAEVKVDTTSPAPTVKCVAADAAYTCTANGSDAVSGIAGLAWSVDGSVPVSVGNGGTFTVAKGSVVVYASDNAGNGAASPAVSLADRSAPAPAPTPRVRSEAVLLRKGGAGAARLVGQLAISSLPEATTIDLRPLAIGKGSFQFVFKITNGKKTKRVTKTQTVGKFGYSKRISVAVGASSTTAVSLTVRRKSGKRWVTYATAAAKL
jgi:hypothetical protein